jgi:hypothetical protein
VDAPDQPGRAAGDTSDPAGHPGSLSRRCHGEGFRYVRAGGCARPASGGSQVAAPGPHYMAHAPRRRSADAVPLRAGTCAGRPAQDGKQHNPELDRKILNLTQRKH